MPILTVHRGDKVFREVHFGSGDICVMKAKDNPESPFENILLMADDGNVHEIGGNAGYGGKNTDQIQMVSDPVLLKFEKSASVQVLIEDLLEIQQNLINNGK